MLIGRDKDGFSVYLSTTDEEMIAKKIMNRCEIRRIAITVAEDDESSLLEALWSGMEYSARRTNEELCDDILGSIRYVNGEEMKNYESV